MFLNTLTHFVDGSMWAGDIAVDLGTNYFLISDLAVAFVRMTERPSSENGDGITRHADVFATFPAKH